MRDNPVFREKEEKVLPLVVLRTSPGEPGEDLVAAFQCLPVAAMVKTPEVVTWGERTFVFKKRDDKGNLIFVEGLSFPLVEDGTAKEAKDYEE